MPLTSTRCKRLPCIPPINVRKLCHLPAIPGTVASRPWRPQLTSIQRGKATSPAQAGASLRNYDSCCRLLLGCNFKSNVCFKHLSSTLYPTASVSLNGEDSVRLLATSACKSPNMMQFIFSTWERSRHEKSLFYLEGLY